MLRTDAEAGFTLIEVVCVLAIVGLLAALVLPAIPRATSQEPLAGYASKSLATPRFAVMRGWRRRSTASAALSSQVPRRPWSKFLRT
jgi:general secretion pathway protein H